jgi:hypothetical protein
MPNTVNLYEPRKLMELVKITPPVRTFLRDTFFKNRKTFTTKSFDVDFVKGARELAPFVSELYDGDAIYNRGYSTTNYEGAYIAPHIITTADDLMHRYPGEQLYSDRTPADRAVEKLSDDFTRLEDMVTRREEWMCAKAIFTGKIPVIGKGVSRTVDFQFTNKETITDASLKWSAATAKILDDIDRYCGVVADTGFVNCNIAIMARDVAAAVIDNAKVQKLLDINNYNLATIAPRDLPNGTQYIGSLPGKGLDLYVYNEKFLDSTQPDESGNPTLQSLVPSGTIAFLSSNANYSMYYGAVTFIPEDSSNFVTVPGIRVPHTWVARRPDRRFLSLQSRPMPIPHNVDSWFVAKVL